MTTEKLRLSDYEIIEEFQSKIDPDNTTREVTGLRCPSCKTTMKPMEHREERSCPNCGLHMRASGNSLTCTKERNK